jgi:beta-glucosidase
MTIDKIREKIKQMTLQEKASLCSGSDFWHTASVERLGIPAIMMADGPHGLRKVVENPETGESETVEGVCFPPAVLLACSWDKSLLKELGETLADESLSEQISILLGPAINIKRSPLCGRNFEYLSEDPYLSGNLSAEYIKGVQSKGVGTSLKHFTANNQEHKRLSINERIDERTFREIYLSNFEIPIKEAKPWTVMCAYNKINGTHCSEHKTLLTDILKDEWGFDGIVISDWGAVNQRVDALKARLELEMPASDGIGEEKIINAVQNGSLDETTLDHAVERLLTVIFKAVENRKENCTYDKEEHHAIAARAAAESMVLLKNEGNVLPLKKSGKIAVIGEFAEKPRFQGGGSSHVNAFKIDAPLEEIRKLAGEKTAIDFAKGYEIDSDEINPVLLEEAKEVASTADVVVLFAGLPERYESEGYDRKDMHMPLNHNKLIETVTAANPNTIVVLNNGAPVEIPWINDVRGLLEAYLGGQACGSAIAKILFGETNPSGKLAETFPERLEHNPSFLDFPGDDYEVNYNEGLYVGYRYYDKKKMHPLFPFGFGLSYTTFEYGNLSVDKDSITDEETLTVTAEIKNSGTVSGKEIVQLYVSDQNKGVSRPEKELKGFEKIELNPGETKTVTFKLDKRSFAYYNTNIKDWHVQGGTCIIAVGSSSDDIRLEKSIKVESTVQIKRSFDRNSTMGDIMETKLGMELTEDIRETFFEDSGISTVSEENQEIADSMLKYMPLRGMMNFGKGKFTEKELEEILEKLNA